MSDKFSKQTKEGAEHTQSIFGKSTSFLNSIFSKKKSLRLLSKASSLSTAAKIKGMLTTFTITIFGFIIAAILISTIFVPMNTLFKSPQDLRTTQQKIRAALISNNQEVNSDQPIATYMEKTYNCKNLVYGGNTYSTSQSEDVLKQQEYSRAIRVLVNVNNPEDGNTCYVHVTYRNLRLFTADDYISGEENPTDSDPKITADEIVYAYANAVNTTLDIFGRDSSVAEGDLGSIAPSTRYGRGESTVGDSTTVYLAGYIKEETLKNIYINKDFSSLGDSINEKTMLEKAKEIYGLPSYDEHSLGNTVSIQWGGDNAPETTIQAEIDDNGNLTSQNKEEVPSACIADPQYGSPGSSCSTFTSYNAAVNHTYYKGDDGKYYVSTATSTGESFSNLKCGSNLAYGSQACFADEKIQKTIKIAVENGFVLRYPLGKENETGHQGQYWTFTYVGKDDAKAIYNNGNWLTLESYYGVSGSNNYEKDDTAVDENYTSGAAGGKNDALEKGVANKLHYISSDKSLNLVKCGNMELTDGACEAFKTFQEAVKEYKEDGSNNEESTSSDDSKPVEPPDDSLFKYEYTEDENGNEVLNPSLTDSGKDWMEEGTKDLSDPTDDKIVDDIKKIKSKIFVVESSKGVNEYTINSNVSNQTIYKATSEYDYSGCEMIDTGTGGMKYADDTCYLKTEKISSWESLTVDNYYNINVPMKIDLRGYKKDEIEASIKKAKGKMAGQGRCVYTDDPNEMKIFGEDEADPSCTDDEVERLFWLNVAYYYNQMIGMLGGGDSSETYYDDDGNRYTNIYDDGTKFSVDGKEGDQCLYTRIVQGIPTTKAKPTGAASSVETPEEIAKLPDDTIYYKGSSANQEMFDEIANYIGPHYYGGQCTDFVWWRFKLQYGLDTGGGNGMFVAANTAAIYPDQFKLVTITKDNYMDVDESYGGSIISQPITSTEYGCNSVTDNVGHVLFLEKVDTSGGEPIIWYSEGNYNPNPITWSYGDIRINMRQSLSDFLNSRCGRIDLCVPIS